jgi:hypothetical protein
VNLNYVLLGHTQFSVDVRRQREHSYLTIARQYVSTDVRVSILRRFGEQWDLLTNAGRASVGYRETAAPAPLVARIPDEHIWSSGLEIGYRRDKTRTGLGVEYRVRNASAPVVRREYERLRVGLSVSHVF